MALGGFQILFQGENFVQVGVTQVRSSELAHLQGM
jgi:hypothetical protein